VVHKTNKNNAEQMFLTSFLSQHTFRKQKQYVGVHPLKYKIELKKDKTLMIM